MKKLSFFLILINVSTLFALDTFFVSNASGILLEKIDPSRKKEFQYVVEYKEENLKKEYHLFKGGKEVSSKIQTLSESGFVLKEDEYTLGLLKSSTLFQEKCFISERSTYSNQELIQIEKFVYKNNNLNTVSTFDKNGKETEKKTYSYTKNGQLREFKHENLLTNDVITYQVFYDIAGAILRDWTTHAKVVIENMYNKNGTVAQQREWKDDVLEYTETFQYNLNGFCIGSELNDFIRKEKIIKKNNKNGLVETKEISVDSKLKSLTSYIYDDQKRLKEVNSIDGSLHIKEVHDYSKDGISEYIERYANDSKERVQAFNSSQELLYEEYYKNNELILKTFFENGIRIREEIYRNGVIIRARKI